MDEIIKMNYYYKKEINLTFRKATEKVKKELKNQGFGVLTEINIKDKLKEKLDIDSEDYIILGACNPPFAYEALQSEKDIGLLLPCNVVIYKDIGKTYVSIINPLKAMSVVNNKKLKKTTNQINKKLKEVFNKL